MKPDFKVYFNKRKRWIDVYVEDVSQKTFNANGGGRWGYFLSTWNKRTDGSFGEIHFVKSALRLDTVVHEVFHAVIECAWMNGEVVTRKNEEAYACLQHELFGKIEKGLKRMKLI